MNPTTDHIEEVGIDYITTTTNQRRTDTSLDAFGHWLVKVEAAEGQAIKPYRASGYRGLAAGATAVGRRGDGAIVRLSGTRADSHWQQCLNLSTNCSRIDLQVTVTPWRGVKQTLTRHWKELRHRTNAGGRPAHYKMITSHDGPETLYLGKRVSDRFGRIYDKFAESGLRCYQGCLRYELELKNDIARHTALMLDASMDHYSQVGAHVQAFVRERSIETGWDFPGPALLEERKLQFAGRLLEESSWANQKAVFIGKCIGPMVKTFVRIGELPRLLEALGLQDQVLINPLVHLSDRTDGPTWEVM